MWMLELAMLASHVISHVTVGIFVVAYSWVDPINTLHSSAHHDSQQEEQELEPPSLPPTLKPYMDSP